MSMTRYVPHEPLESYNARFHEHFVFERHDGILEVRMHTQGQAVRWNFELHRALHQMFTTVGADPDNELIILTGTGDHWIDGHDMESFDAVEGSDEVFREVSYDTWYVDGTSLLESLLWNIHVPVIAVINGPGFHTEFGLLADLTIAADDAQFFENHFFIGLVPGDGQFLVYQQLLGLKRANYAMYIRDDGIGAVEALELGLVNEILPRDQLMDRARALAAKIMEQPRLVRRLTSTLARQPWKRLLTNDFSAQFSAELWAANVSRVRHDEDMEKKHFESKDGS